MKTQPLASVLCAAVAALAAGCSPAGGSGGGGSASTSSGAASGSTGTSTGVPPAGSSGGSSTGTSTGAASSAIRHVFVIVKENHTFDNFFGNFPGANGTMTGTKSNGQTVAMGVPFTDLYYCGSNTWDAAHTDYNGGAMDSFDKGQTSIPLIAPDGPFVSFAGSVDVAYYTRTASSGVLRDAFFTSVMGPSVPNHMFTIAATSGGEIDNPSLTGSTVTVLDANGQKTSHPES